MREIWLRTNRRAILLGCVPPAAFATCGAWLVFAGAGHWRWPGILLILTSTGLVGLLLLQMRRPRVAFESNTVLFYLRGGPPIAVPAEIVESFFAGQSPAYLPGIKKQPQTVNLIARLSQRHKEWAKQTVKPALGHWSDGYVTIRGTWCEPLDTEVIRRLNRRLKEVKEKSILPTSDDAAQT
jgi:hypothetical protein